MQTQEADIPFPTEAPDEQAEAFHICDEASANWFLRKLANLEAEKARIETQAEHILKQLESDAERLRHLYAAELENYVRQELAKKGNRRKSLPFLQGTCQFRTVPASIKVSDPNAALHHAQKAIPDAVKSVPMLDTAKYREEAQKALQANGELLPGMENVAEREAFSIKFGTTKE